MSEPHRQSDGHFSYVIVVIEQFSEAALLSVLKNLNNDEAS
jgi:hypothetical protein